MCLSKKKKKKSLLILSVENQQINYTTHYKVWGRQDIYSLFIFKN